MILQMRFCWRYSFCCFLRIFSLLTKSYGNSTWDHQNSHSYKTKSYGNFTWDNQILIHTRPNPTTSRGNKLLLIHDQVQVNMAMYKDDSNALLFLDLRGRLPGAFPYFTSGQLLTRPF